MQSVFSALCPEFGKARRVSRELIYVICAGGFFVSRVELAYACKKCSVLANSFQFCYFRQVHLYMGKNFAENYAKIIPLKERCVKTVCRILEMYWNNRISDGHEYSANTC
jgi:hypothetical protein